MNDHGHDRRPAGGRRDQADRRLGAGVQVMLVLGMLLCFAVVLVVRGVSPALTLTVAASLCALAGKLVYRGRTDSAEDKGDDSHDVDAADPQDHEAADSDGQQGSLLPPSSSL